MTLTYSPLFFPLLTFVFSLAGTAIILPMLKRVGIMDTPNARSNHAALVPRGGGIAMMSVALLFLVSSGMSLVIAGAALVLMIISFIDDMRGLSVKWRLLAQFIAVIAALSSLPGRLFPAYVPQLVEWVFLALAWIWFINLTNFMDGIDGITSMQVIMMAIGICAVRVIRPELSVWLPTEASVIAAAVLGFYWFNRPPAKLFMGDAGSVPLGFLMGYLLLSLAMKGQWIAALILPAYYLSDATFTLLKRLKRGEKIWQAHSQHAYQQAVRTGLTHRQVVCRITGLNMVLVVLAMLATLPMMAGIGILLVAYALTAFLLYRFTHATSA